MIRELEDFIVTLMEQAEAERNLQQSRGGAGTFHSGRLSALREVMDELKEIKIAYASEDKELLDDEN